MDNRNKDARLKAALMLNIIAPSRIAFYSGLAERFNLLILHGGTENNRESWDGVEERIPNAVVKRAWGFQLRKVQKVNGKAYNPLFTHINPGLAWHLLRFRPDVLISNEMGFRTLIALLYGTLARRPVWVWWGGTQHTERKIGNIRRTLRFVISRWASNWVSYGQTSTDYLMTLGVSRERILEAQNCVDERIFQETAEPAFQIEQRPVLLHVGQFIGRKGIDLLLKAAAFAQRRGHAFSLLLVGGGPDKPKLQGLADELQLKNVRFEPGQEPLRMSAIYRSADILIFPTLEDVWGLVANEAMLCGLPVLCSKYAGCASELFSAENIFDPLDANEFASKLCGAVVGNISAPDTSRLMATPEVVSRMVRAIEVSVNRPERTVRPVTVNRSS